MIKIEKKSIVKYADVNSVRAEWKKVKNDIGNMSLVIELIKIGLRHFTRGYNKRAYAIQFDGLQRRSKKCKLIRGEVGIEKILLEAKTCLIRRNDKTIKRLTFKTNAAYLGGKKQGNIIADLFGLDEIGSPVAAEVKITDKGPWYAVVECIAQVVLLRGDRKELKKYIHQKLSKKVRARGSWGIVIAPLEYYANRQNEMVVVGKLIKGLEKNTEIRICCVSFNSSIDKRKDVAILNVVCGRPPLTRVFK